jgi:hypothetical protein
MRKSTKCPHKIIAHSLVKYMAAMAWPHARPNLLHPRQYGGINLERAYLKGNSNIFLLFHLEELLKLYVNLFYQFCITLLFLEIFEQKKSQISELSAILDFGGYACDIISRVTQEFYP